MSANPACARKANFRGKSGREALISRPSAPPGSPHSGLSRFGSLASSGNGLYPCGQSSSDRGSTASIITAILRHFQNPPFKNCHSSQEIECCAIGAKRFPKRRPNFLDSSRALGIQQYLSKPGILTFNQMLYGKSIGTPNYMEATIQLEMDACDTDVEASSWRIRTEKPAVHHLYQSNLESFENDCAITSNRVLA